MILLLFLIKMTRYFQLIKVFITIRLTLSRAVVDVLGVMLFYAQVVFGCAVLLQHLVEPRFLHVASTSDTLFMMVQLTIRGDTPDFEMSKAHPLFGVPYFLTFELLVLGLAMSLAMAVRRVCSPT